MLFFLTMNVVVPSQDVFRWKCPGTGLDSIIERIPRLTKGISSHLLFDTRKHFMLTNLLSCRQSIIFQTKQMN